MTLRFVLVAVGAASLVGSILVERPERFAITTPASTLVVILGAGAIAHAALPLRRGALITAIATVACGFTLFLRLPIHIPVSAAIVALQLPTLVGAGYEARRLRTTPR